MTLGKRIKRIRTYRGMTQRELGIRLGYKESGADIRIAQYEMGHRKPKKDTLYKMAEILSVSPIQFIRPKQGSPEDLMQMFFWQEEENKAAIHVFKIETGRRDENEPKQYALSLGSNDAQSPFIGIRFSYGQMEAYLNEWMVWRECLANGQITEQEYLDWKWNWHI